MASIRFTPDKNSKPFVTLEFSLQAAESVLSDEFVLTDSRGIVGIDKQQELGFLLTSELHGVIEEGKNMAIRNRKSVEFVAETDFGAFYLTIEGLFNVPKSEMRINIFIDTYQARLATFKNILNELIDFQAAYAS